VIEFMVKIFNADPNLTNAMNKLPFDEAVLFNHKEAAVRTINNFGDKNILVLVILKLFVFFFKLGITCKSHQRRHESL